MLIFPQCPGYTHEGSKNQNSSHWFPVLSFFVVVCVLFVCSMLKRIVFLLLLLFIFYLFSFATQHTYINFFLVVAIVWLLLLLVAFCVSLVLVHEGKCAIKKNEIHMVLQHIHKLLHHSIYILLSLSFSLEFFYLFAGLFLCL